MAGIKLKLDGNVIVGWDFGPDAEGDVEFAGHLPGDFFKRKNKGKYALVDDEIVLADSDKGSSEIDDMTVTDLKAECKKRGLSGYSKLKKDELIELLENN